MLPNDRGRRRDLLLGLYLTSRKFFTCTLVMPITAMFVLYEVVPIPQPKAAAKRQPIPSIPIPRLIAYFGGGGAPDNLAQA